MIYRPPAPSSSSPQLAEGDLQWEVVGYHTYNTSGVAPQAANPPTKSGSGQSTAPNYMVNSQNLATQANQQPTQPQTTDIEVEVSDRWPLDRPAAPTGMSCPASGFGNGLDALDIDLSGGETSYYAGDRFVVAGNFDLTNSPYATNPNLIYVPGSKKSGQVVGQVGQLAFDNLFIDWGDGTVQKITAVPNDSSMTNWSRGETMNLPAPNSKSTRTLLSRRHRCSHLQQPCQLHHPHFPALRGRCAARECVAARGQRRWAGRIAFSAGGDSEQAGFTQ